jgi:ornithine cyclodeaminase/alanine dehydrogenase-like protein (mu-crystallin family)
MILPIFNGHCVLPTGKEKTMPAVLNLGQIQAALKQIDPVEGIIKSIEEGFVAYSQGKVVVPPIGELVFEKPRGETHIKYGYIREDDYYVIKIASGFMRIPNWGFKSPMTSLLPEDG